MRQPQTVLVTGGAGFIGSNFIRHVFQKTDFRGTIVNFDKLTYAGNPHSLEDVQSQFGDRYRFSHGDIAEERDVSAVFQKYSVDAVVNFAAESHVDRSIHGPAEFIRTNILGTYTLLQAAREHWLDSSKGLFHHVSTDEVFGTLGTEGRFFETTAYDPRSPYSASKASSDHLVLAWHHTYGLPMTLSNCSNNYGPYHFPEKLIPLTITNLLAGRPVPVYGTGSNVRDWLYVEDHAAAIWTIITKGRNGEKYNVGGNNELTNLEVVHSICRVLSDLTAHPVDEYLSLITFVKDRPGHDFRYAIDSSKIQNDLGWRPSVTFEQGLRRTVAWFLDNSAWVNRVLSGDYRTWIETNYTAR